MFKRLTHAEDLVCQPILGRDGGNIGSVLPPPLVGASEASLRGVFFSPFIFPFFFNFFPPNGCNQNGCNLDAIKYSGRLAGASPAGCHIIPHICGIVVVGALLGREGGESGIS